MLSKIKKYFDDRKEAHLAKRKDENAKELQEAKDEIQKQKEAMMNLSCLFVEGNCIGEKCNHFEDGFAYDRYVKHPFDFYVTHCEMPRCKLWRND